MEELKVATSSAETCENGWRLAVRENLYQYAEKVRIECERVKPFIQDTVKYLNKSIQTLLPEKVSCKLKFRTVGSLDLGTVYSLSTTDHCLDILLWSTEDTSLQHAVSIQKQL